MENQTLTKKVFVTGCFDMLHSGHVAFLKEAAQFGNLFVCIGSDENVKKLKGRYPVTNQQERSYMLQALSCVHEVRINSGWGILDFESEIEAIKPDIFIVNADGHAPAKEDLCNLKNIEYKVLQRIPHGDLPVRSTTALRTECSIPFRIDLAGGWLDQPMVSQHFPGSVLTISIEPTVDFNDRSGMSSSTRRKAIELWKTDLPIGDKEQLAKMLFAFENPPGTKQVSGSQDSIGIVYPGLNRLNYDNNYWPTSIENRVDEDLLQWVESHLYLVTLGPRIAGYNVLENTAISVEGAKALADAAAACWDAILNKNVKQFGHAIKASFEAQIAMFPNMIDEEIQNIINQFSNALGWKLSGAGGGGYLILVSDKPIENALQIKIRRGDSY
jgi:cytidyltransferase-like protein